MKISARNGWLLQLTLGTVTDRHSKESVSMENEDYTRIAEAIAFMRQHHLNQPDLSRVAQHIGLSKYHFQRLFTQWAGISPKRFLQYLTVEYAKSQIQKSKNLLDLTSDVGLSSPGRLHDLFVTLEAMSPGEFKAGGAGLHIAYDFYPTQFGLSLIATTSRGICNLYFLAETERKQAEQILRKSWPNSEIIRDKDATEPLFQQIFHSEPLNHAQQPLALLVKGTNFQIQVWRALLNIPFAQITSYQIIANKIGRPTAVRAVANAIGKNPISYLIPCHRVIRGSGELGGYRWGLERKSAMMGWEASYMNQKLPEQMRRVE